MNLYPTILTDSISKAQFQLDLVKDNPLISTVQMDIIDAIFADAITITPADIEVLDFGELQIDFHLMTEEPLDYVYECVNVRDTASIRGVIAQVEKMSYQFDYIEDVKKQGWKVGLALDMHTPLESIDQRSWQFLDMVQLMAVETGSQGQSMNPLIFNKVKEVVTICQSLDHHVEILVDGGIKLDNFRSLLDAGVEGLAVGSALWQAEDVDQVINDLFQD